MSSLREMARAVKHFFPLLGETLYWMCIDLWHSNSVKCGEKEQMAALMVANHTLEKGLTMPGRRLGFGYAKVRSLIRKCQVCIESYTSHHIEIQVAIDILQQYYKLHEENHFELPDDIVVGIKNLIKEKETDTFLCFETTRAVYFAPKTNFKDFALSRHSVRWYSEEKVSDEAVLDAVRLAQTAPSACNRQEVKVYVISSEEKKNKVLQLHRGHTGFGEQADKILLITSDMAYWECNHKTSAFLDAGIFTMNLLYALHDQEICACTLNAHLSIKNKKRLKSIVGYSDSEIPVVFIAIGKAAERFMITGSQRVRESTICKMV